MKSAFPPDDPHMDSLTAPAADLDFYVHNDPIFGTDPVSHSIPWQPNTTFSPFESPAPTAMPQSQAAPLPTPPTPVAGTAAFWTVGFWQQFFNVDTADVQRRIQSSVWPLRPPDYLATKKLGYLAYLASQDIQEVPGAEHPDLDVTVPPGNPEPDLYGPLWISCTLWLTMAVVAQFTQALSCPAGATDKACQKGWFALIMAAGGMIFTYQLLVPLGLWLVMKWQGLPVGLVDTICLYGYSLFVFIPAAVICAIPLSALQWTTMAVAFTVSILHIICNLYGIWKQSLVPKWFMIVFGACIGLHAVLCLAFKFQFFWSLKKDAAVQLVPVISIPSPAP